MPQTITLLLSGLLTGWALILAIGAQNAFILRQGLLKEHVGKVVAFAALSDIILIGVAVAGVGTVLTNWPGLMPIARWGGGLFIIGYGLNSAWRARKPGTLTAAEGKTGSAGKALATIAALTWLNPHLYVDILMLGTVANSHGVDGRWWFYAGLVTASVTWFASLGYGARLLRPLFAKARAWQVLDGIIAVVMVFLGTTLIVSG